MQVKPTQNITPLTWRGEQMSKKDKVEATTKYTGKNFVDSPQYKTEIKEGGETVAKGHGITEKQSNEKAWKEKERKEK